jgi:cytochrome P450
MTTMEPDIYYDPYDFEIDSDPYPVWKRLRDERPLYYNERYDFYALSRFDDVDRCSLDWESYVSSKGTVLELIKSGMELPPGSIIFEDPPAHNIHRRLLSRVFTPRNINDLEPKVREFCARSLDPLVGSGGFDFIEDLGAQMPMRTIGMLLGIPEQDQEAIRDQDRSRSAPGGQHDARLRHHVRHRREPRVRIRGVHRMEGHPPLRRPHDRSPPGRVRGRDRDRAAPHPPGGPRATSTFWPQRGTRRRRD